MTDHFHDIALNAQIAECGYAVVPFAKAGEIAEILRFYQSLVPTDARGTYVTMFHPSYDYRRQVDDKIKGLFEARAASYLRDYRALFANFMVKESGKEGDFPVHQDWTYVNESQLGSYAFWIPMQDVDAANGALHVVPGSHRLIEGLRGPFVHEPYRHLSTEIKSTFSSPVALRAGEALVWDHRLIHFSLPNLTTTSRLAFTLIMVPQGAQVLHCYGHDKGTHDEVDVFAADTDFYLRYTIGQPPVGLEKISTIKQEKAAISIADLAALKSQNSLAQ